MDDDRILQEFSKLERILKELINRVSYAKESEFCFIVGLGDNSIRFRLQPLTSCLIFQQYNAPLCPRDYDEERKKVLYSITPALERIFNFSYSAHDMLHWCIKNEDKDKYYATEDIARIAQSTFMMMGSKIHSGTCEEDPRLMGKSSQSVPDEEFLNYAKKPRLKE